MIYIAMALSATVSRGCICESHAATIIATMSWFNATINSIEQRAAVCLIASRCDNADTGRNIIIEASLASTGLRSAAVDYRPCTCGRDTAAGDEVLTVSAQPGNGMQVLFSVDVFQMHVTSVIIAA